MLQTDERAEAGQLGDIAGDQIAHPVELVDALPGVLRQLLDADRDSLVTASYLSPNYIGYPIDPVTDFNPDLVPCRGYAGLLRLRAALSFNMKCVHQESAYLESFSDSYFWLHQYSPMIMMR